MEKLEKWSFYVGKLIGHVAIWFLSATFLYWGWSVVAPHLNAPMFTYWEMFAIRMAINSLFKMVNFSMPDRQ